MVVHFPISFLLLGGILELYYIRQKHQALTTSVKLMVWIGGVFAVLSAVMGWLLMRFDEVSGELLNQHQYLGIATAILSIVAIIYMTRRQSNPNKLNIALFRGFLFASGIGVILAGHMGGSLTHGSDYLTSVTPMSSQAELPIAFNASEFETEDGEISMEGKLKLLMQVRGVFAHKCYKCHSSDKQEGELRLDEKKFVFAGGENGEIIIPENPEESELIRRIKLPKDHDDVMPSKGKLLTSEEISLLSLWVEKGAVWPEGAEDISIFREAELAPRKPPLPSLKSDFVNTIDIWVDDYFQQNNIDWKATVDDGIYLRRIYLDILGLLPSPEEVAQFSADTDVDKDSKKVLELLSRQEEYSLHWLSFWNDILRNDYTGTGYITRGRFGITDWLYTSIKDNKPYDEMVKELLNPDDKSKGFISGIKWRGTVNASQRTEMQAAQNVAQVMLGLNLKCASCHDSFISDWKLEEAYAFANIFADTTLEINRCEKPIGKYAGTRILWSELGEIDSTGTREEKLASLSEKLVQPANGRLYRTIVNRIWAQMMGRGIVEPVDEMDNLPWSQDLLDGLAVEFVEGGYDIKALIYKIATSKIYRSPSVETAEVSELKSEDYVFRGMVRRRLSAEQFSDAVSQVFNPLYGYRDIKFNPYPENKTDTLPPFFVRSSLVANNEFLTALGRPNREVVATSRESQASLLEALELMNGNRLNQGLQLGAEKWIDEYDSGNEIIQNCYQKLLGRQPNNEELSIAGNALGQNPETGPVQDFFWAMLLHPEFQLIF
ncbi:hypothetical protein GCM10025777_30850 [Membranihabitans marinus]